MQEFSICYRITEFCQNLNNETREGGEGGRDNLDNSFKTAFFAYTSLKEILSVKKYISCVHY